jgi:3-oxoadipate enol-lactonase
MKIFMPEAVLFLHAFPLCSEMFLFQMEELKKRGIPFVAPDYPGFNLTPPLEGETSIERLTNFVVESIRSLGIKGVIAVGDSMGGYIIFDMIRRYKGLLKGAVFVSTRAEGESPEGKKARSELAERVMSEGKGFLIDMMLENQTSPATKKNASKMALLRAMMEKASEEGIAKTLIAIAERKDSTDLLGKIDIPVLVVAGEDDGSITPPEVVGKIAEGIEGARFEVLPDSAHLPPFENPVEFNKLLIDFVEYCNKT